MSSKTNRGTLSLLLIIPICMLGAFGLAWAASALRFLDTQDPPEELQDRPEQMVNITGIDVAFFHDAIPVFQGESGELYQFDLYGDPSRWETAEGFEGSYDTACSPEALETITDAAGTVTVCREIQTLGEWCPGPILAFAIDSDGDAWMFRRQSACFVETWILYGVSCLAGLILGMMIAGGIWLVRRRKESE